MDNLARLLTVWLLAPFLLISGGFTCGDAGGGGVAIIILKSTIAYLTTSNITSKINLPKQEKTSGETCK